MDGHVLGDQGPLAAVHAHDGLEGRHGLRGTLDLDRPVVEQHGLGPAAPAGAAPIRTTRLADNAARSVVESVRRHTVAFGGVLMIGWCARHLVL